MPHFHSWDPKVRALEPGTWHGIQMGARDHGWANYGDGSSSVVKESKLPKLGLQMGVTK